MGKGACIKSMVAIRNYSTNTIMEKNKQMEKGGRVTDMEFSGVKYKSSKNFLAARSAVIINIIRTL